MKISKSGFTVAELMITVTIILILASITIASYNGIQKRNRDTKRLTDMSNIVKALDIYNGDTNTYPATSASPSANGCTANGYSYSWATDGTWLNPLVTGKYIDSAPIPPKSSCTMWYSYLNPGPTAYGCASRTKPYFVLIIQTEGSATPPAYSKTFTPCVGASATWTATSTNWVISSDNLPS